MADFPLAISLQAQASAAGTVTIQSGPNIANESWTVNHQEVNNSQTVLTPEVLLYRNFIAPAGFIEGTLNGVFGASDTVIQLQSSEVLYWVWSNVTPGTFCAVTLRGVRHVAI